MKSSLVLSAFLGYSGSCNEHQGQTQWASEMSRGKCCLVVLLCLQTKPLLPMMTNPKYQKLYNVTPGCLWQPAVSLLWSIQSLLQSQSVPAAWCIFTSAIDYQTIFDDYSSSPILVSVFMLLIRIQPIRGIMMLKGPMRGQKTVSMAWSSCATMRVMEEGEKWWYINMSMHLSAPLKPTWTNRVMGQFKT